jgi:GTPase SAR1 family protein
MCYFAALAHAYMARMLSNQIDAQLAKEKERERSTIKVLLLGGAESGKTTIFKQMR